MPRPPSLLLQRRACASTYSAVRGTHDHFGASARAQQLVSDTVQRVSSRYGFSRVDTPIFEFTDVFQRTLGEQTDVVSKEMYTFDDRSGQSLTLRPEGTTSVVRAYLSRPDLRHSGTQRLFYSGRSNLAPLLSPPLLLLLSVCPPI